MSIAAMIAARQKAQAEASAAQGAIETGMASSANAGPVDPMSLVNKHLEKAPEPEASPQIINAPEGAYLFIRLQQLICKGGRIVKPDAMGFYVPQNADEEARLKHLEAQDCDWVKKVG